MSSFRTWLVVVGPGAARQYDESEWRGAVVVVERGAIELECLSGGCRRFGRGAVLWLSPLPLRELRNTGAETAVLRAVARRTPKTSQGGQVMAIDPQDAYAALVASHLADADVTSRGCSARTCSRRSGRCSPCSSTAGPS
jgi:hypothetical protein